MKIKQNMSTQFLSFSESFLVVGDSFILPQDAKEFSRVIIFSIREIRIK